MIYAENRRVRYQYTIVQTYSAGLLLSGQQASAIRKKMVTISSAFVVWRKDHLEAINLSYHGVEFSTTLLLKKKEMLEIRDSIQRKGITCIVVSVKNVKRWIKADIAIVKAKKLYNKKALLKERDLQRQLRKGMQ